MIEIMLLWFLIIIVICAVGFFIDWIIKGILHYKEDDSDFKL